MASAARRRIPLLSCGVSRRPDTSIIQQEVEMLQLVYPDTLTVEEVEGMMPVLRFSLEGAAVEVQLVAGYPYEPPIVEILLESPSAAMWKLSESKITHVRKQLTDALSAGCALGLPCIQQVVQFVESAIHEEEQPLSSNQNTSQDNNCGEVGSEAIVNGNAADIKTKWKRLAYLALHLLRKCSVESKEQCSMQEATQKFSRLSQFIDETLKLLPPQMERSQGAIPAAVNRLFHKEIDSTRGDEELSWLWRVSSDDSDQRIAATSIHKRFTQEFNQIKVLGAGGFAPVFLCRKKVDGRLYAVKKIAVQSAKAAKALREVETLSAMSHENIVRYFDAWVEEGCDPDLKDYIADDDLAGEGESDEEGEEDADCEEADCDDDVGSASTTDSAIRRRNCAFFGDIDDDDDDATGDANSESQDGSSAVNPTSSVQVTPAMSAANSKRHSRKMASLRTLYIQMELCGSNSLRNVIDDGVLSSPTGERIAESVFRQLLNVVAYFHKSGMVHRDLKPDNVLFQRDETNSGADFGSIKIADFGLARRVDRTLPKSSSTEWKGTFLPPTSAAENNDIEAAHITRGCGTVLYCAPEQESGAEYQLNVVDEYSVGMIALEMWLAVAGKDFRERFEIMNQVRRQRALPEWFVSWNKRLASVLNMLLAHDPAQRSSCSDVLLKSELPGEPIELGAALETISQYGSRMMGRLLERIRKCAEEMTAARRTQALPQKHFFSIQTSDMLKIVQELSTLHGALPLIGVDNAILLSRSEYKAIPGETVIDSQGRPLLTGVSAAAAVAAYVATQQLIMINERNTFSYMKHKPRPTFLFGALSDSTKASLEPLLYLCHVLRHVDVREGGQIEVHLSHFSCFSKAFIADTQPDGSVVLCPNAKEQLKLKSYVQRLVPVDPTKTSAEMEELLTSVGLSASEQESLALLEELWGELTCDHQVKLVFDPCLKPSEPLIHSTKIQHGFFAEALLVLSKDSVHDAANNCNLASYFPMTEIVGLFSTHPLPAYCVVFDLTAISSAAASVEFPKEELVLNQGVVAAPGAQSGSPHQYHIAAKLWRAGVRCCVRHRIEKDRSTLCKTFTAHRYQWLLEGSKLTYISQKTMSLARTANDIPFGSLGQEVRDYILGLSRTSSHGSTITAATSAVKSSSSKVDFIGKEDSSAVQCARDLLSHLVSPLGAVTILAVQAKSEDIRTTVTDFLDGKDRTQSHAQLFDYLRRNQVTFAPIYSMVDGGMEFVTSHALTQGKQRRRRDHEKGGKK